MAQTPETGLPVPPELQRGKHRERQQWLDSAAYIVGLLSRTIGRSDLAGIQLLDVGCGTKIVKRLLDHSLPVGRYVGIDVSSDVIGWLQEHVRDDRFEFHHLDAHNALYNPGGRPLAELERLPAPESAFDLIGLFSVFTHLAPDDYVTMLRLLRRHVKPDGRLVFSVFLNDPDHPSPYAAALEAQLSSDDPEVAARAEKTVAEAVASKDRGFLDEIPETPLLQARYDKDFALELIDGTGWEVLSIDPPGDHTQHCMTCRPA